MRWFVLLMWGVLLCSMAPAVTSYLNAVGLSEYYYHQAKQLVSLTGVERGKVITDLATMLEQASQFTSAKGETSVCGRWHQNQQGRTEDASS